MGPYRCITLSVFERHFALQVGVYGCRRRRASFSPTRCSFRSLSDSEGASEEVGKEEEEEEEEAEEEVVVVLTRENREGSAQHATQEEEEAVTK